MTGRRCPQRGPCAADADAGQSTLPSSRRRRARAHPTLTHSGLGLGPSRTTVLRGWRRPGGRPSALPAPSAARAGKPPRRAVASRSAAGPGFPASGSGRPQRARLRTFSSRAHAHAPPAAHLRLHRAGARPTKVPAQLPAWPGPGSSTVPGTAPSGTRTGSAESSLARRRRGAPGSLGSAPRRRAAPPLARPTPGGDRPRREEPRPAARR